MRINNDITTRDKIDGKKLAARSTTKKLTTAGLLIALNLVLNQFTIPIGTTIEVGFAFLPIAVLGYLFGPLTAGLAAAIADIIGFFLRPSGFFFPGFTLNALLSGAIYGLFLHRKKITLPRVALTSLTVTITVSLIFTPIWLNIMYETPFVTIPRIIKSIVLYPIDVSLLYFVLKNLKRIDSKERILPKT